MDYAAIKDMTNTYVEHSIVINNFVISVGSQLKKSLCCVFGDSVKYKWMKIRQMKRNVN